MGENDPQVANPTTQFNTHIVMIQKLVSKAVCTPQAYRRKTGYKDAEEGLMRILKDKIANLIKSNYEKHTANILSGVRQCFLPEFSTKTCILINSTQYCSGHSSQHNKA